MTVVERFMRYVSPEPNSGCWLWTGTVNLQGYGQFWMPGAGRGARRGNIGAHRASMVLFGPGVAADMQACHRCDNPACVNPAHLFAGTKSDNLQDAARKGRCRSQRNPSRGEDHPRARLTADDVREIRALWRSGHSRRRLAERFGVSRGAIDPIVSGRGWRSVA